MKSIILSNWNFMRVLRLALGIFIAVQGIQTKEWLLALLGGSFFLLAILNTGCCGLTSCKTPSSKTDKKIEDITYEDVS